MRGQDEQQLDVFSYVSPEQRVPQDHPLRPLRVMTDEALRELQPRFRQLYAKTGRPSIAPEKLLRALLLQALYSVRSERLLMEQLDYNLLFRWFVGLNMDDAIWDVTVFTKNRERLLDGNIAEAFFQAVLQQARERSLLSDEHFTVDGTLLEAWASVKSYQRKNAKNAVPPDDPGNATVDFHGEKRSNQTHASKTDPDAKMARKGKGKEAKLSYNGNLLVENRNGLIVNTQVFEANGTAGARCRSGDAGTDSGNEAGDRGRRQGIRHGGFRGRVQKLKGHAARGPEPGAARWERH
jgi:transposase